VVANIQKVIACEGGNEYKEGRESKRSYRGQRRVGHLYKHLYIQDDSENDDYEDVSEEDNENSDNSENGGDEQFHGRFTSFAGDAVR